MSHQHRKLSEGLRQAGHLRQVLESEVHKSEYSRGLYNGFELLKSIIENREPNIIQSKEGQTYCIDCGVETKPGNGSARCPSCWDDKTGCAGEEE